MPWGRKCITVDEMGNQWAGEKLRVERGLVIQFWKEIVEG